MFVCFTKSYKGKVEQGTDSSCTIRPSSYIDLLPVVIVDMFALSAVLCPRHCRYRSGMWGQQYLRPTLEVSAKLLHINIYNMYQHPS